MTPAEFEQLVQAHLDDPTDAAARAALEQAAAAAPELAALLAEYRALEATLTEAREAGPPVDAAAQHRAISAAVDQDITAALTDARLDAALAADPLAGRVHWPRLQQRIAAAVDAELAGGVEDAALDSLLRAAAVPPAVDWERFAASTRRAVRAAAPARRPGRILRLAAPLGIGLAAAAAWFFMLRPGPATPDLPGTPAGGGAVALLSEPAPAIPTPAPALAYAAVDTTDDGADEDVPTAAAAVAAAQDEYFTIAPAPRVAADAYADVY